MKVQNLVFLIVLLVLIFKRKPRYLIIAGIVSFILSIPFFATWTFFTAQHLVWYGAGFILLGIVFSIIKKNY